MSRLSTVEGGADDIDLACDVVGAVGGIMLVSVIIPTHNRPEMLIEALTSVRAQTFIDYEIIVVSNGESDDVRTASQKAATAYGARYFALAEGNVSAARNFAIERAKGEWVAFLDDDDLWLPTKLERQIAEAERTGADLVSADYIEFHQDGREIVRRIRLAADWCYVKAINYGYWWAQPSAVIVRKSAIIKIGGFDPGQLYAEDLDAWSRLARDHKIHQIEETLLRYRCGHASMMRRRRLRYLYDLRLLAKRYLDTPRNLRHTLPSVSYITPRLVEICSPDWLLNFLHWLEPRRNWLAFRRWLKQH
jgi:glycosyltransferase involved in cell wall biosynthesis